MGRDFTLIKYRELLETISRGNYSVFTVHRFLTEKTLPLPYVILRHDVDRQGNRALATAMLEKDLGLEATYYFRVDAGLSYLKVIKEVAVLGHEVGYHYEVLSKAKGNWAKARYIFAAELRKPYKKTPMCAPWPCMAVPCPLGTILIFGIKIVWKISIWQERPIYPSVASPRSAT